MSFQRNRLPLVIIIGKFYGDILYTDDIDLRKPGIPAHGDKYIGIIAAWQIRKIGPVCQGNLHIDDFPIVFPDIFQVNREIAFLVVGQDRTSCIPPAPCIRVRIEPADIIYICLRIPAERIIPISIEHNLCLVGYCWDKLIVAIHHIIRCDFVPISHR